MNDFVLNNDSPWMRAERGARRVFGESARLVRDGHKASVVFNNNGEEARVTPFSFTRQNPGTKLEDRFLAVHFSSGTLRGLAEYRVNNQGTVDLSSFRLPRDPGTTLPADHPVRQFVDRATRGLVDAGLTPLEPVHRATVPPRPEHQTADGKQSRSPPI